MMTPSGNGDWSNSSFYGQVWFQCISHLAGACNDSLLATPHCVAASPRECFVCLVDVPQAAVNTTVIHGTLTATRAQAMSARGRSEVDPKGGQPYSAAALSLVFHSAHPLVPTLRADVRLFQVGSQGG